jgi:purine-binding chemotaxis protein CheW
VPLKSDRALVVFSLGEKLGAFPLESVEKIAPMAELARPPGLPTPLEGILNFSGTAVPVLRLDRLLQLPERRPGLYSMLVLLKADRIGDRVAMMVDRVLEILYAPCNAMLPVAGDNSFNSCVEATVARGGQSVHVLSPGRILVKREQELLSAFRTIQQRRLDDWTDGTR